MYFFENLEFEDPNETKTFVVREVMQNGWTQTLPGGPDYEYTVVAEPNNVYGPYDFGNTDQVVTKYGGGDGTAGNPYQIWTATHMNQIGTHQEDWASHFILMDDIDMGGITGEQYNIIGYHNSSEDYLHFTGTFDGNNHVIQNFTYVTSADQSVVGLFGYIENAQIIDLTLTNVTVSTAGGAVGGLAGYQKYGTISNCHTDASVMGQSFIGGLIGFSNAGMISQCSSTGSVTNGYQGGVCGGLVGLLYKATVTDSFSNAAVYGGLESHEIGGLLGIVQGVDAVVERCYSSGDVTAGENSIAVGGLAGYLFSGDLMKSFSTGNVVSPASEAIGGLVGTISMGTAGHCYSLGNVTASGESIYVGGFVGVSYDDIACCFSTGTVTTTSAGEYVGGFAGLGYGVFNSFWDIWTSSLTYSNGGKGRTTLQMQEASNYINWNTAAQTNWVIDEGNDYPHLIWEGTPGIAIPTHNITGYLDGLGTPAEPYLVQNASDLNTIGLFDNEWDKDYRLTADIDMSGITGNAYNMIGTLTIPFSGTFDGDGYWVDHFTYTSESIEGDAGLFKVISGTVRNLSMENTLISINGGTRIGILAGTVTEEGVLDNCYTQGSIETSVASDTIGGLVGALSGALNSCESTIEVTVGNESDYIGGLIGYAYSDSVLTQCGSVASITTGDDCQFVGGLAGRLNCSVTQSYADGTITTGNYTENLGGLVGYFGSNIDMTNCYSKTEVIGGSYSEKLGGLIGWSAGDMEYCYSMGLVSAGEPNSNLGGLVGYGSVAYQCYWDTQTSGQSTSATGTGRDTEQMLTQSTYSGWDFNNTWRICDGMNYPRLQWEPKPAGDFVCPEGVETADLAIFMNEWLAETMSADMAPDGSDGMVDLQDWIRFASAWQSQPGDPAWDDACDLAPTPLAIIGIDDLMIFSEQWLARSAYFADIAPLAEPDGKVNLLDYCVLAENWLLGTD
jgi:hypothetical protein